MTYPIEIRNLNPSLAFFDEVVPLIKESKEYLLSHKWCKSINKGWLFINIGYAVNVFLYNIENEQSPEDDFLWVIVGDLPPIFLDTHNVKSTKEAVQMYVDLADDWVDHVESRQSLDECFPFDVTSTSELVGRFKERVRLLQNSILPNIPDIRYDAV
jgi:hypothetical protein